MKFLKGDANNSRCRHPGLTQATACFVAEQRKQENHLLFFVDT